MGRTSASARLTTYDEDSRAGSLGLSPNGPQGRLLDERRVVRASKPGLVGGTQTYEVVAARSIAPSRR